MKLVMGWVSATTKWRGGGNPYTSMDNELQDLKTKYLKSLSAKRGRSPPP